MHDSAATVVTVAVFWGSAPVPLARLGTLERRLAMTMPPWRRREWSTGRLAARAAVRRVIGQVPPALEILPDEVGAPCPTGIDPNRGFRLSVSHCAGWSAAACATGPATVGVDIELAEACDPATLARVTHGVRTASNADATRKWSRLEAAYKACKGNPPLLSDYRLEDAGRLSTVTVGEPARSILTWCVPLSGAVMTVASTGPVMWRQHVIDAERESPL